MKRTYKFFCILFLPLILFINLLSSCTGKQDKKTYKIGFSQCIGSDQWRKTMLSEMKRELSFYPEATLIYEEADGNSRKQVEQVKSMLKQDIDILIISPNEARPLTPIVEEAYNKGIPVVVIDRKISSELYTAYVGADNFEVGKMAGEYIVKRLNFKGNVAEVMGLPGSSPAIERQRGFYSIVKNYPEIKISTQLYGNWLNSNAKEEISKNISNLKNTDVIFAHNDQMALGSYEALRRHNMQKNIKIVGVDALPGPNNGLGFVSKRILDASILYPTGGKEAIRTAFAILNNQSFNKNTLLKSVAIDSANAHLMQMQEERMESQHNDIERQQQMLAEQQRIYKNQQVILNILVVSLVLAIVFAGIAFYALAANWKNNKRLEAQNREIKEHEQQLIEMSAKAAVATEAKFNFFTQISHEFRTPLTLILMPLEELLSDNKTSGNLKNHLHLIHKNVIRLLRMVNQLIDFRKIEYDKMKLRCSEHDIIAFTREIISSFKDIARQRNIDLRVVTDEPEIKVWFDLNLFDKVLFNLLSNAFKFTHEDGKILINISKDINNQQVIVQVEDNGTGMSENTVVHAFELFFQGETAPSQGSGLGLALSKEIVEAHKGSIKVKSEKNKWTVFTITLPLGDTHLSSDEKLQDKAPSNVTYNNIKIYTTELEEKNIPAVEEDKEIGIKEKSLLIIEDNVDLLAFLEQKFAAEYEVFTATNGNSGIQEAFEKVPDLIISDIVIPNQSGIEVAKALKNDIRTSHIPIILLTAKGSEEQQIEGIQTMADTYITKPFNFQFLNETVKNLLYNRALLKSRFTSDLPNETKPNISKIDKKFVNDFSSLVESNLGNESFNVDDICKNIGISRIQLYRKVKALFDCSITEYILNRRLQKAKYLLANEDIPISEITYSVGFASPTYFSTVFKNKYGCTPTEFRKVKNSV